MSSHLIIIDLLDQSEEERQAELRERARRLLNEARKGSVTTTTEIIRVITPEPIKQFDETDEKLQKLSEQITHLELQTHSVGEIQQKNGEEKSSREKITPDKLPDDLRLAEVGFVLWLIGVVLVAFFSNSRWELTCKIG